MTNIDPRLAGALRTQFEQRRKQLSAGAAHVGWKLGMGDRERIGGLVIGYVTSATELGDGSTYLVDTAARLHADAELTLQVGEAGAIAHFGVALELVDLASPPEGAEAIVAENVFHRAVAFGPLSTERPERLEGRLIVNGELRAEASIAA